MCNEQRQREGYKEEEEEKGKDKNQEKENGVIRWSEEGERKDAAPELRVKRGVGGWM